MPEFEQSLVFGTVIDVLEAIGATYAIWGGVAVVAHGETRFTYDMDILLSPVRFEAVLFIRRLRESHFYVDEGSVNKVLTGGFFNVIHQHYQLKVDFYVPTEPILQQMIQSRIYLPFDERRRAAYVTATSVVIAKLRAFENSESTRHLEDIASIIRMQGNKLETIQIEVVAAQLGILGTWRAIWSENKP